MRKKIEMLLKYYTIDEVANIIQDIIDKKIEQKRKLFSIKIGDLINVCNKQAVVIELTDDNYVLVQFIGMKAKAYVERSIIIKDNNL